MFKLLEKKSIAAYLVILTLIVLIGLKVFVFGEVILENHSSIFFQHCLKTNFWSAGAVRGLVFFCILCILILYANLFKDFSYHSKSGLIGYFVLSICTIVNLYFPFNLEGVFSVLFFLLLSWTQVNADKSKDTTSSFYKMGMIYLLSLFISAYMAFYLVPIFLAIFVFGRYGLKDLLALVLGVGTLFIILWSFYYIFTDSSLFSLLITFSKKIHVDLIHRWDWLLISFLSVLFLMTQSLINSFTINTRKYYTHLFLCVMFFVPAYVFFSIGGIKQHYMVLTLVSFYLLPVLFRSGSLRVKNYMLFFGFVIAFLATFVCFK